MVHSARNRRCQKRLLALISADEHTDMPSSFALPNADSKNVFVVNGVLFPVDDFESTF